MFEKILTQAIKDSQYELINFISNKYSNDDSLSVENLQKMFLEDCQVRITNDKFEISKGRGRPKKN